VATARSNALRVMWRLEALRHALGDHPLIVTSGFRSRACNSAVDGASNSQHLYGSAADVVSNNATLCRIVQQARYHGFGGLFGPGYPGHNDHIHCDIRGGTVWDAPSCGV
jgi:zinc D-Ala-D-Ala carboxypeptidase